VPLELGLAGRSLGLGFGQVDGRGPAPDAPRRLADGLGAVEDAGQRVIVALRDRVELVVVAAGTAQGQAKEGPADLVDLLVDDVDAKLGLVGLDNREVAQDEKAGRHQAVTTFFGRGRRKEVAGELLADKGVERLVGLKRGDDVVAIAPGVLGEDLIGRADLVGIAHKVEPVASPALGERA